MRTGRPREFDVDCALEAALQLFWGRGYGATSLSDLLDTMGIARSSFYQTFGSKRSVFEHAIDRYRDRLLAELRKSLAGSPSAAGFLRRTLHSVADDTRGKDGRRGCLVFNSAAELGQSDPELAGRLAASIDAFAAVFAEAVTRAQHEGDVPPDNEPALLARHLVCTMSGLRTLARAGASRRDLLAIADVAMSALDASRPAVRPRQLPPNQTKRRSQS